MRHSLQKLNSGLLALAMALLLLWAAPAAFAADASGTCGDGLTWTLSDGRLTISGSGDMTDYNEWDLPPWYELREEILWLSLPEGLASVGNMAFYDCVNLTAVTLPSSVRDVGELAFCQNRSMTMLSLNSGLASIGRSAFEQCESLQDLRLPDALVSMGTHAFYRCTALSYVTIPASVTEMGSGVFAYCDSLIRADVYASMDALPTWTFYGCEKLSSVSLPEQMTGVESYAFYGCGQLNSVYYGGTEVDAESLKQQIGQDVPGFEDNGSVLDGGSDGSGSYGTVYEGEEEGTYVFEATVTTQTDNATVTTTTETTVSQSGSSVQVGISAGVTNDEGWQEVIREVKTALEPQTDTDPVEVTVYAVREEVPETVVGELKDTNVRLNVQTQSGARFVLDMGNLGDSGAQALQLSYTISLMEEGIPDALAGYTVYTLNFSGSGAVNMEILIRLPGNYARQTATLYKLKGGTLTTFQSVVVDDQNYAHFYLASVDEEVQYLIGLNVSAEEAADVIVPENLYSDYGVTDTSAQIEYVVTGRTSSWGLNIKQVTWIMIGVIAVVVIVVGVTTFALNKRKLKRGYIPDLGKDE